MRAFRGEVMSSCKNIAIVTGAFGFAGASLTENLLNKGYEVYAVCREGSEHNERLDGCVNSHLLHKVYLDMQDYDKIHEYVDAEDIRAAERVLFFHLSWGGARDDFEAQYANVEGSLKALDSLKKLSEKAGADFLDGRKAAGVDGSSAGIASGGAALNKKFRFIGIGSQAEYGVKSEIITEDLALEPFTAYGSCKAAAFHLLKSKARIYGIDFVWGRIFSLIGKYEPAGRMLPDLAHKLLEGKDVNLSSCEQFWDYLDVMDAAEAIALLGEKGRNGESYNIANGDYHELSYFVEKAAEVLSADKALLHYGKKAEPFVSLKPSVEKIKRDTGWSPSLSFEKTLRNSFIDR